MAEAGAERRQHVRHPVNRPFLVCFGSARQLRRTYVRDISRGGLFIRTRVPRPLRSRIEIVLELPDGTRLGLHGEVVYCVSPGEAREPSQAGVGIRFLDMTDSTEFLLEEYIALHTHEALSPIPGELPTGPHLEIIPDPPAGAGGAPPADSALAPLETATPGDLAPEGPTREFTPPREVLATPMKPEEQRVFLEMALLLENELAVFESTAVGGSSYDVLGVQPSATQDGIAAAYAERLAELDAARLRARLPQHLRERIERAREVLQGALEVVTHPLARAQLDLRLNVTQPAPRSQEEQHAFQGELARRREAASSAQKAEYALARPYIEAARREAAAGRRPAARDLLRAALLFDPYNAEYRGLLAAIESFRS